MIIDFFFLFKKKKRNLIFIVKIFFKRLEYLP